MKVSWGRLILRPKIAVVILLLLTTVCLAKPSKASGGKNTLSLKQAVSLALQHDGELLIARNELQKAHLNMQAAYYQTLPQVSLEGDYAYQTASGNSRQNYQVKLQETLPTKWQLYGRPLATPQEVAGWDIQLQKNEVMLIQAKVILNTVDLYLNILKLEKVLNYRKKAVIAAAAARNFARKQLSLGKIIKTAELQTESNLANARFELAKAQKKLALGRKRLANQLGFKQSESLKLNSKIPESLLGKLDYQGLKEVALTKRIEVAQQKIILRKADQEVAMANNQLLPIFSLGYYNQDRLQSYRLGYNLLSGAFSWTAAWQKKYASDDRLLGSDLFGEANERIALEFSWELGWGMKKSELQKNEYSLENGQRQLEKLKTDLLLEMEQKIVDYEIALALLVNNQQGLPLYEKEVELKKLEKNLGRATKLELAEKELELYEAKVAERQAHYEVLLAGVELRYVLGELYQFGD